MGLSPDQLRSIASGYRLSQLVHACASLGIPDVLAGGPASAGDVAAALGTPPDTTARLLRAAASEGVLDHADGRYRVNEFSAQLRSDGDGSMRDFVLGWWALRPGYIGFSYLDGAVRQGRSGVELAFGERFHDYMRTHPDDARRYEAAMESTVEGFEEEAMAYDFSAFKRVVDVGGGQGSFLVAIRRHHPGVTGVLFDLPDVVAGAPARLAGYPESSGIEVVGGDMFADVPPGGDAYLFSTVLRCFEDEDCVRVLRNCREKMAAGGRVLAVEMLMDDGIPPSPKGLADLQALAVYGGKDRTRREWADLMTGAGFAGPTFYPADDPYWIIEARHEA